MNEMPPFPLHENVFCGTTPRHPNFRLEEPLHPVQIAGYCRMTAAQKFQQLEDHYRFCVSVKRSQFAKLYPEWSDAMLEREARRATMYGSH